MSHMTKVKDVKITDSDVLRQTVEDLKKEFRINCELVQNSSPRFYSGKDESQNYDYVLNLKDCKYDIGFRENESGEYDVVFDGFLGYVSGVLGDRSMDKDMRRGGDISLLKQVYAKNTIMKKARMNPLMTNAFARFNRDTNKYVIEVSHR